MKSIAIASLFVLASTTAQAEIICTARGCWETGKKIILVSPGHVNGAPLVTYRSGKREVIRNLGRAEKRHHDAEFSAARLLQEPRHAALPKHKGNKK